MPERNDLHGTLEREDGDEDLVDDEQHVLQSLRLLVVLDRHRHHVEQDDNHDEDVELLIGHQLEQHSLRHELCTRSILGRAQGFILNYCNINLSIHTVSSAI